MAKKKVQILAYAHARIEVLLNFVSNPRKISPFCQKSILCQNLGLFSVMAAKKT